MKSLLLMALALLPASKTLAQTNAQVFYDFGSDRKFVTLTLEMFKQDKWGNTYFLVIPPLYSTWRLQFFIGLFCQKFNAREISV